MSAIHLYKQNPDTYQRELLGTITEEQLDFLIENLEEDFEENQEYFLSPDTVEYLREEGADGELLALLEKALEGNEEGVDIFYLTE